MRIPGDPIIREIIERPANSGELVRLPCDKPDMGENGLMKVGTNRTRTSMGDFVPS